MSLHFLLRETKKPLAYVAFFAVCLTFGTSYAVISQALKRVDGHTLSCLRMWVACLCAFTALGIQLLTNRKFRSSFFHSVETRTLPFAQMLFCGIANYGFPHSLITLAQRSVSSVMVTMAQPCLCQACSEHSGPRWHTPHRAPVVDLDSLLSSPRLPPPRASHRLIRLRFRLHQDHQRRRHCLLLVPAPRLGDLHHPLRRRAHHTCVPRGPPLVLHNRLHLHVHELAPLHLRRPRAWADQSWICEFRADHHRYHLRRPRTPRVGVIFALRHCHLHRGPHPPHPFARPRVPQTRPQTPQFATSVISDVIVRSQFELKLAVAL